MPTQGGQVPEANLSPRHLDRPARWHFARAPGLLLHPSGKTPRDSRLCASMWSRADGAVCRPPGARPCGGWKAGRERPRCRVADAAPGLCPVGVVHAPQRRCPMRRASSRTRPADFTGPSGPVSVSQHVILANGLTAITSGSMRARRGAVQGSALRSDRALCARLAPRPSCVLDSCRCQ